MMKRFRTAAWPLILSLALSLPAFAQTSDEATEGAPDDRQPPAEVSLFGGAEYPGGHLKYTYKVSREGVDSHSISSTEIIPQDDGTYRVESSSSDVVPADAVGIGFFGIALRGLGFRIPTSTGGTVDLSPLSSIEDEVLEPNREYVLPDGGFLFAGDAGTIAGIDVVYATYTHADYGNVTVHLAMPTDLSIRNLLPIFPYLKLEYTTTETAGDGDEGPSTHTFSTIELIDLIYEP
jgi:hypothetical protein